MKYRIFQKIEKNILREGHCEKNYITLPNDLFNRDIADLACAGVPQFDSRESRPEVNVFNHVDGQIKSINGNMVEIVVKVPEYDTRSLPFTDKMTQRIVSKSFLLENSETTIGNQKAIIIEIRKDLRAGMAKLDRCISGRIVL